MKRGQEENKRKSTRRQSSVSKKEYAWGDYYSAELSWAAAQPSMALHNATAMRMALRLRMRKYKLRHSLSKMLIRQ